jgi:hypothetical protein
VRTFAVLLTSLLCSPVPTQAQEPKDPIADSWNQLAQRLPVEPSAAARMIQDTYMRRGIPLTYLVNDSLPQGSLRGLVLHNHPCGAVAYVQAIRIPPRDRRFRVEHIAELDSTGREIRRWSVPSDRRPVGLKGEEVIVNLTDFRANLGLGIRLNGSYRVVPLDQVSTPEIVQCPSHSGSATQADVRCARIANRLLIYDAPCT